MTNESEASLELRVGDVVRHKVYGPGKILAKNPSGGLMLWTVDFPGLGKKTIMDLEKQLVAQGGQPAPVRAEPGESTGETEEENDVDYERIRQIVREEMAGRDLAELQVALGDRWTGGEIVLKPGRDGAQEKAIPIDAFFHKIVMVRDRLRVLEQNINSHPKLDDADKVDLQQYITRIYGSLTTFNMLFKYKEDTFVGSKG